MTPNDNTIRDALRYYKEAILECLATETLAYQTGDNALGVATKLRRGGYQERRNAVRYIQKTGCSQSEAWTMYGISDNELTVV
jgi:hypothetical protein